MRLGLLCHAALAAIALIATPTVARADQPAGSDDAKARTILDKLAAATDSKARDAAIGELAKIAPTALDAIAAWISREHPTAIADRRKVLTAINASIPDKSGKWSTPARSGAKERKSDDDIDWLKDLANLDGTLAGTGEVFADVAAIRAIAATKDPRAPNLIFEVAFADESMIYRDECGRRLRALEPLSIPVLTRESQASPKADRKNYAMWQLERLDRQDPKKALDAATGDEALQIAVLEVIRETKHREAVPAVWAMVDHDAPRVRAAARKAWMDYITGPPPPPAPRKRLQLPGGKLTKYPKPLWLTYRELADNELRKAANQYLHEDYTIDEQRLDDYVKNVKETPIKLDEVTARLFEYFDGERTKRDTAVWNDAQTKAGAGNFAAAVAVVDRLIAQNPDRNQKAEMADIYIGYAKQLESATKWAEASAAYSKAYGLSIKPHTLAAVHFTLGKALEAAGKDGGADFRKAQALDPEYAPAQAAAAAAEPSKPQWMLYAAIAAATLAMLLFGAAMLRRRQA